MWTLIKIRCIDDFKRLHFVEYAIACNWLVTLLFRSPVAFCRLHHTLLSEVKLFAYSSSILSAGWTERAVSSNLEHPVCRTVSLVAPGLRRYLLCEYFHVFDIFYCDVSSQGPSRESPERSRTYIVDVSRERTTFHSVY